MRSSRSAPSCGSRACRSSHEPTGRGRNACRPCGPSKTPASLMRSGLESPQGEAPGPAQDQYGRRKMIQRLRRNGFPEASKHTVDRLMREEGMNGLIRGRKTRTTIPGKDGRRARDLLNRDFSAPAANQIWVTDFTYVPVYSDSSISPWSSTCNRGRSSAGKPQPSRTPRSLNTTCGWLCGGANTPADRHRRD